MKYLKKRIWIPIVSLALLVGVSSFKGGFFEIAKQIEIFTTLFKELNMNYVDETNPAELMDAAIKNMLSELDPYTVFMNEQDVEAFKIRNRGAYSGIGALIRTYKDKLVVIEPYKDYPADKAGLKAGDEIIQIGEIKVADFKEDALDLLKGAKNSSVNLIYKRAGKTQTTAVKREDVEVDAVPFYQLIDAQTGYIVLSRFNRKASKQTKEALIDLKGQGASRIVLDLRGNPGGLLSEAIAVCNLFVPKDELIVTTKSKVQKFNKTYKTRKKPVDTHIPLVVMVNGRSASASEIVSGALQDLDRAVVLGARSFGKGLVQRPMKLTYGTQLKVTISRYYTPSGRCIQSLDYWNRDKDGKAKRNENFEEFKTRNGRKVYDGGGVLPDVEVEALKSNALLKALEGNQIIFDFATEFVQNNQFETIHQYRFENSHYNQFKEFVANSSFSYKTKSEKHLEKAREADAKEANPQLDTKYEELLAAITQNKIEGLDRYKTQIVRAINDELVKRYFYREGLYTYYLTADVAIQEATALLADGGKYSKLLK
ncbi:MAG: S41 family peptidase [Flavobacteriaceae bacterium]|nr:S41 family peptidase [Flavobacteriaceae bacterium]